jgi:hypothetical protein
MILNLKADSQDINDDFKRIASELMNHWILKIENSHYRITEIEFYFNSNIHNDNYTHSHELQKKTGSWYFHGSGVDITFGNENSYGGILIRALYNLDSKIFTYGPIKVVTELFSNFHSVYNNSYFFGLIEDLDNLLKIENPIAAPRVGLNKTNNPEMRDKFYRYLVMPSKPHAEKTNIEAAMRKQNYPELEIKNIWK